jgi:hypothetical protein
MANFMGNKKSDPNKQYNWLMGADMYLAASVILCEKMLESYVSPKELNCLNMDQQIDKKCGFTSANPDYEMLMPVIFNFKHGIELYLKALIMQVDPKQEYPATHHDLRKLLDNLIVTIKNTNNTQKKNILEILDKELRNLIEKYYYGLYAFSYYKVEADINNEAERYPEYKNNNCYEIDDLCDVVCNELLKEIRVDVVNLQKYLREKVLKKI